jgi:hypothetical protein
MEIGDSLMFESLGAQIRNSTSDRRARKYDTQSKAHQLQVQAIDTDREPKKFVTSNRKTAPNDRSVKYNTTASNPTVAEIRNAELHALIVERARQIK